MNVYVAVGVSLPVLHVWPMCSACVLHACVCVFVYLHCRYPGLGDEQLMYVKLGRYKDLRPIDTNKLQV